MTAIGSRAVALGEEVGGSILRYSKGPSATTNVGEVLGKAIAAAGAATKPSTQAVSDARAATILLGATGAGKTEALRQAGIGVILIDARSLSQPGALAKLLGHTEGYSPASDLSSSAFARNLAIAKGDPRFT